MRGLQLTAFNFFYTLSCYLFLLTHIEWLSLMQKMCNCFKSIRHLIIHKSFFLESLMDHNKVPEAVTYLDESKRKGKLFRIFCCYLDIWESMLEINSSFWLNLHFESISVVPNEDNFCWELFRTSQNFLEIQTFWEKLKSHTALYLISNCTVKVWKDF